ncbi:uncharacterized protein K452DRAFT_295456 [Aplosporella prunicola CBS 121167]|uniref:BCS1 N-terminal domain-containing protein n=1 Tax=Aplosporella prunicola CBS 121167 TaxID=1176127 RepID=A0A6A6BN91_9PEZI|nr:uncharacterized protein K452DRAFT_295456 [Aplosporella prunicola CBS 121167]KAF2144883.1 hypothetical protein K452DRAFT_295456 [Aplosporella prunicola CBS 121167]
MTFNTSLNDTGTTNSTDTSWTATGFTDFVSKLALNAGTGNFPGSIYPAYHLLQQMPLMGALGNLPLYGMIVRLVLDQFGLGVAVVMVSLIALFMLVNKLRNMGIEDLPDFLISSINMRPYSSLREDVHDCLQKKYLSKNGKHIDANVSTSFYDRHAEKVTFFGNDKVEYGMVEGVKYFFWYGCVLCSASLEFKTECFRGGAGNGEPRYMRGMEDLVLRCFWYNVEPLKKLVQESRMDMMNRTAENTTIHNWIRHSGEVDWNRSAGKPRRPMSTIDLDGDIRDTLIRDAEAYFKPSARRWYARRGIPYRRGWLFHGPGGTEIQGFLLIHRDDPLKAIELAEQWAQDVLTAKELKTGVVREGVQAKEDVQTSADSLR